MRFEYWKNADDTWAWHLRSPVGNILATGPASGSRDDCMVAIKLVKLAASATCREIVGPVRKLDEDSAVFERTSEPVHFG